MKQFPASKWLWLTVLVLITDQVTKYAASQSLILHQGIEILPMLNFTLVHNYGAAFSFLSDSSGWQRWFFTVIALVVSVVIFFWMRRLDTADRLTAVGLALILGGALGNVWDRILLGYVVDFIDVFYQAWHWPAFNIADSAISIGAVLLIIDTFRNRKTD